MDWYPTTDRVDLSSLSPVTTVRVPTMAAIASTAITAAQWYFPFIWVWGLLTIDLAMKHMTSPLGWILLAPFAPVGIPALFALWIYMKIKNPHRHDDHQCGMEAMVYIVAFIWPMLIPMWLGIKPVRWNETDDQPQIRPPHRSQYIQPSNISLGLDDYASFSY